MEDRKVLSLLVLFLLMCVLHATAGVVAYQGEIHLLPETGNISEDLIVDFLADARDLAPPKLYLNSDLKGDQLSCDQCADHSEGAVDARTNARPIAIRLRNPLKAGEHLRIRFTCSGKLVRLSEDTNSFTQKWVELSIDSGWYPYELENRSFRYNLNIKIDPAYELSGNADISSGKGKWHLLEETPTFDIDIVAGRHWRTTVINTNDLKIRIHSVDVPPAAVETVAHQAGATARTYSEWFGNAAAHELTIILNPREDGSSYSRPGYVSLAFSKDPLQLNHLMFNLAHEVAHFWWVGAPGGTWENWLNESFAEYSALMYVRNTEGETAFKALMQERVERSRINPQSGV